MSVQDIIDQYSQYPYHIMTYFAVIIGLAIIGYLFVNSQNFKGFVKYAYGALIYAVSVPALLAFVLTLYSLFFLRANLLNVDFLSHFLPIIVGIVTLVIINKTIPISRIPGFDRLSSLFMVIMIAFVMTYVFQKMFFGVFFVGSFTQLIAVFVVMLVVLRVAWQKIIR